MVHLVATESGAISGLAGFSRKPPTEGREEQHPGDGQHDLSTEGDIFVERNSGLEKTHSLILRVWGYSWFW